MNELKQKNPFENMAITTPAQGSTAIADAAIQREVSEVQAAVILARKFPRNQKLAMDRILVACQRKTLAAQATYSFVRGGTEISGASIRLAEAIAQAWENIQFGIRELEQRSGESTVEAYAWDLETNVRQSKVFQVPHKRYTKKGTYALSDPRDIYELTANQGARRLRACILGIIPGDVIEAAVEEVEKTLHTSVEITPESIKTMLAKFAEYNVTTEQIEKRIQRRIDTIQPAQFVALRKIYNSLKDGMSGAADWFEQIQSTEPEQKTSGVEAAKQAIAGKKAKKEDPRPPEPEVMPDPEDATAKVACPNNPGDLISVDWCERNCPTRAGCPSHED